MLQPGGLPGSAVFNIECVIPLMPLFICNRLVFCNFKKGKALPKKASASALQLNTQPAFLINFCSPNILYRKRKIQELGIGIKPIRDGLKCRRFIYFRLDFGDIYYLLTRINIQHYSPFVKQCRAINDSKLLTYSFRTYLISNTLIFT